MRIKNPALRMRGNNNKRGNNTMTDMTYQEAVAVLHSVFPADTYTVVYMPTIRTGVNAGTYAYFQVWDAKSPREAVAVSSSLSRGISEAVSSLLENFNREVKDDH